MWEDTAILVQPYKNLLGYSVHILIAVMHVMMCINVHCVKAAHTNRLPMHENYSATFILTSLIKMDGMCVQSCVDLHWSAI